MTDFAKIVSATKNFGGLVGLPGAIFGAASALYGQVGQGYEKIRHADRRTKEERDSTSGRMDAGNVQVRYVDSVTGEVWTCQEAHRLYIPVSRDWNAMTVDRVKGNDGKSHWVLVDGLNTIYEKAVNKYSPDVGRTIGTVHLSTEELPVLPGDFHGPDRHISDIDFVCPDTTLKKKRSAGRLQKRKILVLDPALASEERELVNGDVEDLKGNSEPLIETPGIAAIFPYLHERIPNNARSNCLLKNSTKPSPYGGVLNTDTIYGYKILKSPTITTSPGGVDYCDLIPSASSGLTVDTNVYSIHVAVGIMCEWINRMDTTVLSENIKRAHSLAKADGAVLKMLICAVMESNDWDEFKGNVRTKINTEAVMKLICQTPCGEGAVETETEPGDPDPPPPPPPPPPGSGGSGTGTFVPSAPPGASIPPAGSVFGSTTGVGPGGGSLTTWTSPSGISGSFWVPPGGTIPAPGSTYTPSAPSDMRLKNDLVLVGSIIGVPVYSWRWNQTAIDLGYGDFPSVGVVAQELIAEHPDLVSRDRDGFMMVDYAGLHRKAWAS